MGSFYLLQGAQTHTHRDGLEALGFLGAFEEKKRIKISDFSAVGDALTPTSKAQIFLLLEISLARRKTRVF